MNTSDKQAGSKNETTKSSVDKAVLIVSIIVVVAIMLILSLRKEESQEYIQKILFFMTHKVGNLYILTEFLLLTFSIWMIFGKYGVYKIGKDIEKPQYNNFSWGAMLICTGIAGSTLIFAFVEPIYYLTDTPFEIVPLSNQAFEYAHMYAQFHWGLNCWLPYVPAAILFAYCMYEKKSIDTKFSIMFYNGKTYSKILCRIVDVFTVLAILGGIGTSMGICVPVLCELIGQIYNIEGQETYVVLLYACLFIVFLFSVWRGLDKGIKILSKVNVILALVFIIIIFFVANPFHVLDVEMNSMGLYLKEYFHMTLSTEPYSEGDFPQRWTIFYWGWFYAYIPLMTLFIAKISKGRTIKQIVLGILGYGSIGNMIGFMVLGCYSLDLQTEGKVDLVGIMQNHGRNSAVVAILKSLPLSNIMSFAFILVSVMFIATTVDSAAYILSMISTKNLGSAEQPARWNRILWAVILAMFAIVLSEIGELDTVQTLSVLTGFPMIFVVCWCMIRLLKIFGSELKKNDNDGK